MTPKQYDELGDQFEDKEHQLFGDHGFEDIVDKLAELEKTLGFTSFHNSRPNHERMSR